MKLDHIAVAVKSLEEGLRVYSDVLGLKPAEIRVVEEEGVKIAFLDAGDVRIEVMEPLSEDTPVGRFISKRGEGLHHIAFSVPNFDELLKRVRGSMLRLAGEPRVGRHGRYVFIHPKSAHGVLIELIEGGRDV